MISLKYEQPTDNLSIILQAAMRQKTYKDINDNGRGKRQRQRDKDKGTKAKTKDNLQNPGYIAGPCSAVSELYDLLSSGIRQWTTWWFSQKLKPFWKLSWKTLLKSF